MDILEKVARTILDGDSLGARSLVQDWLATRPDIRDQPQPQSGDARVLALSAALAELFAERLGQSPPMWTSQVGPVSEPLYLLRHTATMARLRAMCLAESPPPLRRRRIFAPPDYLSFA